MREGDAAARRTMDIGEHSWASIGNGGKRRQIRSSRRSAFEGDPALGAVHPCVPPGLGGDSALRAFRPCGWSVAAGDPPLRSMLLEAVLLARQSGACQQQLDWRYPYAAVRNHAGSRKETQCKGSCPAPSGKGGPTEQRSWSRRNNKRLRSESASKIGRLKASQRSCGASQCLRMCPPMRPGGRQTSRSFRAM